MKARTIKALCRPQLKAHTGKADAMPVYSKTLFAIAIMLLLAVAGLWWLALLILVMYGFSRWLKSRVFVKKYALAGVLCLILSVGTLAILVRVFVLEVYVVPSGSMEDEIFTGDDILVSKLNYGPKLPQSPFEIPWVNLWFYHHKESVNPDSIYWPYKRLGGFSDIKHNDVIVFKKLNSDKKFLVKRCMGLPGETVRINDSNVFINNHKVNLPRTVKQHYRAPLKNNMVFKRIADRLNIKYDINPGSNSDVADCYLNMQEVMLLKNANCIDSLIYQKLTYTAYPQQAEINWSLDNFGPITVPARGVSLPLTKMNYMLYKAVLADEGADLKQKGSVFYVNGKPAINYVFKYNYYFVLGDNRPESVDSRFWGFVPENAIEGRVICSIFAKSKTGKFIMAKLL